MEAAGALAELGHRVTLIEKEQKPGGHLKQWHALFPDRRPADEVRKYLSRRIDNRNIKLFRSCTTEHSATFRSHR